jgi:hypothetical protein
LGFGSSLSNANITEIGVYLWLTIHILITQISQQ